jgi:hypothetical protein
MKHKTMVKESTNSTTILKKLSFIQAESFLHSS